MSTNSGEAHPPLGYAAGGNLYEYVRSNPTNRIDPWGLKDCAKESASEEECLKCCDDEYKKKKKEIEKERDEALAEVDAWQKDMLKRLDAGELSQDELNDLDAYAIGTRLKSWLRNPWTKVYFPQLDSITLGNAGKNGILNFGKGWLKARAMKAGVFNALKSGAKAAGTGSISDAAIMIGQAAAGASTKHFRSLLDSLSRPVSPGNRRGAISNQAADKRRGIRADAHKKLKQAKKEKLDCEKECRKKKCWGGQGARGKGGK